mmetsp:Transcript_12533/g.14709  ORF Transcript_12533/g.14709 Transcript_12533/m.14709 type:complete len:128 (-) Transcript_12533:86-469(-)
MLTRDNKKYQENMDNGVEMMIGIPMMTKWVYLYLSHKRLWCRVIFCHTFHNRWDVSTNLYKVANGSILQIHLNCEWYSSASLTVRTWGTSVGYVVQHSTFTDIFKGNDIIGIHAKLFFMNRWQRKSR